MKGSSQEVVMQERALQRMWRIGVPRRGKGACKCDVHSALGIEHTVHILHIESKARGLGAGADIQPF